MKNLIIQILINNNTEQEIKECIQSVKSLGELQLISLNDIDLKPYEVIKTENIYNLSKLRNNYLKKNFWYLFINPNETLLNGTDEINKIIKNNKENSYYFTIINNGIVSNEIRLFKNKEFKNNIFETINDENGVFTNNCIISSKITPPEDYSLYLNMWKKEHPLALEPYYYQAITSLALGKYKVFIRESKIYLKQAKKTLVSSVMLRYYLAWIQAYKLNSFNESLRNCMLCLEQNLLLAEVWCLIGDIYCSLGNYYNALAFYDNAILLGSRRKKNDKYPIEISKYQEYPDKMIKTCKEKLKI